MQLSSLSPFGRFFQHGYVTNDLARAVREFGTRWGVSRFAIRPPTVLAGDSAHGPREIPIQLAFAYAGELQIELIHPLGGGWSDFYAELLPVDDFAIRLHHLGLLVDGAESWTEMAGAIAADGYELALAGDNARISYAYVDTRAQLGHYLEIVRLKQADLFDDVPRN